MSEQASLTSQPPLAEGAVNGGDPAGETERAWVRDLADGQVVEAVFGVRERELRQRRNGGQWLRLVVCDSSGTVEAVVWDGVEESFEVAVPGSAVHISGRFGVHPQYGRKITVEAIRPARPEEFEGSDLADGTERSGGTTRGRPARAARHRPESAASRAPRSLLRPGLPGLGEVP